MSVIDDLFLKFQSGNSIPVTDTRITREQWLEIKKINDDLTAALEELNAMLPADSGRVYKEGRALSIDLKDNG